jgi:integrase/recombinase XerD
MYACGLRVGEAAPLRIDAIIAPGQVIRVIGKGNKERHVPLPRPRLEGLRKLWRTHRDPQWLFPNRNHDGPLERSVLMWTFAQAAQAVGIVGATSHSLRHSYAARLLEQRVDVRVVKILLGHASLATTDIYTHLTEPTRVSLRRTLDELMTDL